MSHVLRPLGFCIAFAFSTIATGAIAEPTQQQNSNAVWFENWTDLSNATMAVIAPDGQRADIMAPNGTPVFRLVGHEALDGIYRFKLRAQTREEIPLVSQDSNNGRETSPTDTGFEIFETTGFFVVEDGIILHPDDLAKEDG
ncbi:MAG: hypothetical protein ACSHWS_05610 [Sulfitobacter sp.]